MTKIYMLQDPSGYAVTAYGEDERAHWEGLDYYVVASCDAQPFHGLVSFGNNLLANTPVD